MDETRRSEPSAESIFAEYDRGRGFNAAINLDDTVAANENFFIGKQWEGVQSNGLPTPVFNFLKRVVLFQVATILSDNIALQASPLSRDADQSRTERVAQIVSREFDALFERNKIGALLREFMRNAAVDGDGCTYTYWDPDAESGQAAKGALVTEILDNTRVFFGNPNERRVQRQPYILLESREMLDEVRTKARARGIPDAERIAPDTDFRTVPGRTEDGRVTVLLRLTRDTKTGHIWACEAIKGTILRAPWDLGIKSYPITWMNWDYIPDCYHGQAMITGLIPNQIFVNKTYAMVQLSIMQSAFPKVVYDKTRVSKWTNQAGVAIGVNGGDMNSVARIIEPAQVSPQIAQFIASTIDYTQTFLGGTDAALGEARPDNTSAILALQRASAVPSEMTRLNLYQSVEELGNIYLEFMTACYGVRRVALGGEGGFDFSSLAGMPMALRLDVGASSYWSEIASMQTLDNLLRQGKIDLVDYLERVPDGYIARKQELIDKLTRQETEKALPTRSSPSGPAQPELFPAAAGIEALRKAALRKNTAE